MKKKTYWVTIQTPESKELWYFAKRVCAPSMERAEKIVAGYCDYHNKRHGLSGDRIFRVVPTPTSYAIKIMYKSDSVTVGLLLGLSDKLNEIKSAHVVSSCYKYKAFDDSVQALFFLDGIDTAYGDVSLKEVFAKVLEPYKAGGIFIDYSIETYPYELPEHRKLKNLKTFKRA